MSILVANNIKKTFNHPSGDVHVLKGVDISLGKNEFLVISGRSGSGKSTLLNILSLLDSPTSGELTLNGINLSSISPRQRYAYRGRRIAAVNQQFNLIDHYTARENIALPAYLHKQSLSDETIESTCSALEIRECLDKTLPQLSGGQQQRVAIARALVGKPEVLLMDEPTGNLDEQTTNAFIELIRKIRAKYEIAMIMITHDNELKSIGTSHLTLNGGVLCNA